MFKITLLTMTLMITALYALDANYDDIFTAQSDHYYDYFLNPASMSVHNGTEFFASTTTTIEKDSKLPKYTDIGLKLGGFLGVTYRHRADEDYMKPLNDLGITLSTGFNNVFFLGSTWEKVSKGEDGENGKALNLGTLIRPQRYVSLGFVANNLCNNIPNDTLSYSAGLGLRPMTDRISLYADYRWGKNDKFKDGKIYYGAFLEPIDGVNLGCYYKDKDAYGFNISFNVRHSGVGTRYNSIKNKVSLHPFAYANSHILPTKIQDEKYVSGLEFSSKIDNSGSSSFIFGSNPSIREYIDAIHLARKDPTIKAIYIKCNNLDASITLIEELREAIKEFRSTGKKVLIFMHYGDMKSYYLATACDKIVVSPEGGLELQGLAAKGMFFKGLADRLKISAQYTKHGKYKSAVEQIARKDWSEPARKQMEEFIEDIDKEVTTSIAKRLNMTREQFTKEIYGKVMFDAEDAKKLNLVDEIAYEEQAREAINKMVNKKGKRIDNTVDFEYYKREWCNKPVIVVVNAEGNIVQGSSGNNLISGRNMGSESMVRIIRQAGKMLNCKGIVLRVDSGGGDGLASDLMYHELKELRARGKTVVVSMGTYAASGGYYISTPAERIFADKTTLTGSIGVFWLSFTLKDLADWAGVTTEWIKKAPHAGMFSMYNKMTDEELEIMQRFVDRDYTRFVDRVARDRHLNASFVDSIGQGRVWSGEAGLKLKLVDEIGGLDKAIRYVASKKKMKEGDYDVVYLPESRGFLKRLMDAPSEVRTSVTIPFSNSNGVLYLCPWRVE